MKRASLSTRILGRGTKLDDLAKGSDLYTGSYRAAMRWLSDNWPDGTEWPAGVPRPDPATAPDAPTEAAEASAP